MNNIKYFRESLMPTLSGGSFLAGYHIIFNDESSIDLHTTPMGFSTVDTVKGKDRLAFKKKYTPNNAINLLRQLKLTFGITNTNIGEVVLVNNSNVKKQVIL
jgi:hypothetical protein